MGMESLSRGQWLDQSVSVVLSSARSHVGKVGAHIGKDHHLGSSVKMCAADSEGVTLKTEVGGRVENRSAGRACQQTKVGSVTL